MAKQITKEEIAKLSEEEKKALYDELIKQGLDPVFVGYLIYDRDYKDVIKENKTNET